MITSRHRIWPAIVLNVLVLWPRPSPAGPTLVTYCGQSYLGHGVLAGNLDCSGYGGPALVIERGTLDLRGFTITGGLYYGIHCLNSCWLRGPGTIQGSGWDGVRADAWLVADGVVIRNNGLNGINARNPSLASRLIVRGSQINGNGYNGIEADSAVLLRRSRITGNGAHGVDVGVQFCDTAGRALLFESVVAGNSQACPGGQVCADISVCGRRNRPPRLRRSSCGTSYRRGSGVPGQDWNVCQRD